MSNTQHGSDELEEILYIFAESVGHEAMKDHMSAAVFEHAAQKAKSAATRYTQIEVVKGQMALMDRLEAESYLEKEPKDQNALRAQVVRVATLNNERRYLKQTLKALEAEE